MLRLTPPPPLPYEAGRLALNIVAPHASTSCESAGPNATATR